MLNKIILGTAQLGLTYGINNTTGKPAPGVAQEILELAALNGISTVDTAQAYGEAIDIIGTYHLTHSPFKVITKITHEQNLNASDYLRNLNKQLGTKNIEAVLFHKFRELEEHPEILQELEQLKSEGVINLIGVSVYTNEELDYCANVPAIDVIQLPFNLLDNFTLRSEAIQRATSKDKIIHVRSVFLQGLFFMPQEKLPVYLTPLAPYLLQLREIANDSKVSMHMLAIKYALQSSHINGVLIGVDSVDQLQRNIQAIQGEPLTDDIVARINSIQVTQPELLNPVNWK